MKKPKKQTRQYTKGHLVQARVDDAQHIEITAKANQYTRGNIGEYIRLACMNYQPVIK